VIRGLAALFVALGLGIFGYFVFVGPTVTTPSRPLRWVKGPLDAGAVELDFTQADVDFLHVRDTDEPALSFAVLRRGDEFITFDDFNTFHAVERHDGRLWALGELQSEGSGPSLELLVSEDEGRTFEHRASVPKPIWLASFESWTVEGDALTLELSLDDELQVGPPWAWAWWPARAVGPGRLVLRSKNGGRSWRLGR
jgi:hypothetical protein